MQQTYMHYFPNIQKNKKPYKIKANHLMVPQVGIGPTLKPYHGLVIPLYYCGIFLGNINYITIYNKIKELFSVFMSVILKKSLEKVL